MVCSHSEWRNQNLPYLEDLRKMKAIELLKIDDNEVIPEWQKEEVRKCVKEIEENPSILIDEDVVFNMLNND